MVIKYEDIKRDLKNEFLKKFPKVKVFDNNTFISVFLNIIALGIYNIHVSINYLLKQVFANTANIEHLKLQATNRLAYLQATKSIGEVIINADIGVSVNAGEVFNLKNSNLQFKLLDNATVEEVIKNKDDIDSISSYENKCIIKFNKYINLIQDIPISITNANETRFNGDWVINKIIDSYTIEISINNSELLQEDLSTSPINIKFNIAIGNIESMEKGKINNISPFSILETTNIDIDYVGVNYNPLTGGRDDESEEEYRDRYLTFLREPQAFFNENWIKYKILDNYPKVTRVDIYSNDDEVTIYLINNNNVDLVVDYKTIGKINSYLFDTYKPINLISSKFTVTNPNKQYISFTISNIKPSPNNAFKEVIKKDITNYITSLEIGGYMRLDLLKGYIINIRDYENNYYITTFDISLNNDIDISLGNILIPNITIL